jgi:hypothetical protein
VSTKISFSQARRKGVVIAATMILTRRTGREKARQGTMTTAIMARARRS